MLNRRVRSLWSRKRIAGVGITSTLVSMIVLACAVMGAAPDYVLMGTAPQQAQSLGGSSEAQQQTKEAGRFRVAEAEKQPTTKTETIATVIKYRSSEQSDPSLSAGTRKLVTVGRDGEKKDVYEVTYLNEVETGRKLVRSETAREPINEVIVVGTYVAQAVSVYYANCTEARAAGVAPISQGQPGYRAGLDRDNDGIACDT